MKYASGPQVTWVSINQRCLTHVWVKLLLPNVLAQKPHATNSQSHLERDLCIQQMPPKTRLQVSEHAVWFSLSRSSFRDQYTGDLVLQVWSVTSLLICLQATSKSQTSRFWLDSAFCLTGKADEGLATARGSSTWYFNPSNLGGGHPYHGDHLPIRKKLPKVFFTYQVSGFAALGLRFFL